MSRLAQKEHRGGAKHKFVCFACLEAVKRPPYRDAPVLCPRCGQPTVHLGQKIPIPPKSKPKLWQELNEQLARQAHARHEDHVKWLTARRHELERRIEVLRARPSQSSRNQLIAQLEKKLHDTLDRLTRG